jgi:hypothetical protein
MTNISDKKCNNSLIIEIFLLNDNLQLLSFNTFFDNSRQCPKIESKSSENVTGFPKRLESRP